MEVVLTVITGEIANRSISFLIDKCSMLDTPTKEDQRIKTLQSLLLRACVIVEEAEGRDITNQAMVHQLNIPRKEMYRGYFVMDNFRSQTSEEGKSMDHDVSHPFAISKFNPVKRLFFRTRSTHVENELQRVLDNLNNIIIDMREFISFMKEYPPLHRQPYSMHLILDKCMFGRHMEMERIMNFLMKEGPPTPSEKGVDVLPIVGPATVGKSTLVGHVCNDDRVRNNFARIVFITEVDIKDNGLTNLKDGGLIIHQNNSPNRNERLLYIIEFPEDVDEAGWKRYLAFVTGLAATVKIVITSRSSRITGFGTTQALVLNSLPPEAHWYFFKVITFGSAYPKDHPKLESIAMDLNRDINGSFKAANIVSSLLRDSLDAQHWFVVYKFIKLLMEMNISLTAQIREKRPTYLKRMVNNDDFIIYDCHESFANDMVPKTILCDVLFGTVRCEGKFNVLSWKSRIPPYKNYICNCDMKKKKTT